MSLGEEVRATLHWQAPVDPVADEAKRAALRHMRVVATLLLFAMAGLYVATSFARAAWPWLDYVRAFAEAGVVGACADWFAVVALFRHPFGIPIPHTAIVPHNKARIAGAMGRFVANNFLTPRVVSRRLATIDAARFVAEWLSRPENVQRTARMISLALPEIVRTLPRQQIGEFLRDSVQRGLSAMPAAPLAAHLLAIVWAQGQTQALVERTIELAEASLAGNKEVIRQKLEAGSSRWIPRFVDGMLAERVFVALTATLTEMRNPQHPWRVELGASVESLIKRLKTDPELMARIEAVKQEVMAASLFHDQLRAIWTEIENRLPTDAAAYVPQIATATETAMAGAARWLREDPVVQQRINRWIRTLIRRAVVPRRVEIGAFVTQVVENWDATTLVNRMELQVGKDLQYIRVNGTLVGGLVGLIIYVLSGWLLPA
jgi:uncharacterized membrane-anchored protein YjiN (DUF445 family)